MFNSQDQENLWVIHSGFDPIVDFCIWVLEVDGLQVPPFNQHLEGNRTLQVRGMDVDSWLLWMKQVVLLSDQRMNWHVENSQIKIWKEQDAIFANWQAWQYQQAVTAAREVCEFELPGRLPMPPDLWPAASTVKELLEEMWVYYRSNVFSRREQRWVTHPIAPSLTSELREAMNFYYPHLAALELYLVAYSSRVQYIVPPASVIVSLADDPSHDDIAGRILLAVENLASGSAI